MSGLVDNRHGRCVGARCSPTVVLSRVIDRRTEATSYEFAKAVSMSSQPVLD